MTLQQQVAGRSQVRRREKRNSLLGSLADRVQRPDLNRLIRDYGIVLAGFLALPVLSVAKGVDTYYDFLNIKWLMGWKLARGEFDLAGIAATRRWSPPYLDMWNAAWATVGPWWLPQLVHGLAHACLIPTIFLLARRSAPALPNVLHQFVALISVFVPLVFMQVGVTTGHLYATLPLAWSLSIVLRLRVSRASSLDPAITSFEQRTLVLSGALLALAPLLKPSVLATMPAHLIGMTFLIGSLGGFVAFTIGFVSAYAAGSVGWSVIVSLASTGSVTATQIPGSPISGLSLIAISLVLFALAAFALGSRHPMASMIGGLDRMPWLVLGIFGLTSLGTVFFAEYLREAVPDFRWLIPDLESLWDRLLHTGDLQFGFSTVDLESAYFDTSIPIAIVLTFFALLVVPTLTTRERLTRFGGSIGTVIFVGAPLVANMWATGYTRYATQAVPLVGVAALAFASLASRRLLQICLASICAIGLSLPHLGVDRLSAEIPRFGQILYDAPVYGDFVEEDEVDLVSRLLPESSTVFVVGSLNSFLIPMLDRDDLEWRFLKPKRFEVAALTRPPSILFNPAESSLLHDYAEQGLLPMRCEVLRFEYTSVGVCDAEIDESL